MTAELEAESAPLPMVPMARWRRWLFNQLRRLEERSIARTLGLPPERVLVDVGVEDG